ncbi:MAG: hypothetical protein ACE5WD_14230 [Candidatus Aminicenantia bacterium]
MNYLKFKKKVEKFPIISSAQLVFLEKDAQILRNQLSRWEKRGLIIKLRKGLYILNESDRKIEPSKIFLANQLYSPSYVSTEYALGFYDLIPERVVDVTSVSTRKTYKIKNIFGEFVYQHITPKAFKGFTFVKDENDCNVLIATPEKAIVDFIYLNLSRFREDDLNMFEESYRFQNIEKLRKNAIGEFASYFNNRKLIKIVKNFCQFMEEK